MRTFSFARVGLTSGSLGDNVLSTLGLMCVEGSLFRCPVRELRPVFTPVGP